MSSKRGPPKHQNRYAWKPNAGHKINETEVGGKLRPLSEITGVCPRCKEQIDWKRRYGKYKPLTEPAKCQRCSKRAVRQAYHNLCPACAKEQKVCAKCRCRVDQIVGRDLAEVENEQKMLEEAIKNARERDRRTFLRAMNKGKSKSSEKVQTNEGNKVGDLFPSATIEDYAARNRHGQDACAHDEDEDNDDSEDEGSQDDDDDDNDDEEDNNDEVKGADVNEDEDGEADEVEDEDEDDCKDENTVHN